ncbi:hypothetical protein UlMin_007394 [Ulmus minor]
MTSWQRHIQSIFCHVGKRVEHRFNPSANLSCSHFETLSAPTELQYLQKILKPPSANRPFYQYSQQLGISTTRKLLADLSNETLVRSPLTPALALNNGKSEDQDQKVVSKPDKVQAMLKCIKQPSKENLKSSDKSKPDTKGSKAANETQLKVQIQNLHYVCHTSSMGDPYRLYGTPIQPKMTESKTNRNGVLHSSSAEILVGLHSSPIEVMAIMRKFKTNPIRP